MKENKGDKKKKTPEDRAQASAWASARSSRRALDVRSYFSYLIGTLRAHSIYNYARSVISYVRRIGFIGTLFRFVSLAFATLQTGALFVTVTAAALTALPVLLIFAMVTYFQSLIHSKSTSRSLKRLFERAGNKNIYVFFLSDKSENASFSAANVEDICRRFDGIAVAVSPYFFGTRSPLSEKSNYYYTARVEHRNVFLVRKYYFFNLRRSVLRAFGSRVRYVL